MNTLIIEPNSKADYQIFVSLEKRLNVTFREEKAKTKTKKEKTLLAEAALLKNKKRINSLLWQEVLTFLKQPMN